MPCVHVFYSVFNIALNFLNLNYAINYSPQAVCCEFGTVIVPSHGGSASQFGAFDTAVLILFPVHG